MKHDTRPATKHDVETLKREMLQRFDEERRHTEVLFEQLRHDVLGGFKDFASTMQDKLLKHDRRIRRLERHAGLIEA